MEQPDRIENFPENERKVGIGIPILLGLIIIILIGILVSLLLDSRKPTALVMTATPTIGLANSALLLSPTPAAQAEAVASPTIAVLPSEEPTFAPIPEAALPTQAGISPLTITKETADKGDYLMILGGEDNLNYKLGPLAKGVYAIGPNNQFLAYVTNDGKVYAARIGESIFITIGQLKGIFSAINRQVDPFYEISFDHNGSNYLLIIREERFGQKVILVIPRNISQ